MSSALNVRCPAASRHSPVTLQRTKPVTTSLVNSSQKCVHAAQRGWAEAADTIHQV